MHLNDKCVFKELGSHLDYTKKKWVFLTKRQNLDLINGANEKNILLQL